jgi:hypothetical protein
MDELEADTKPYLEFQNLQASWDGPMLDRCAKALASLLR